MCIQTACWGETVEYKKNKDNILAEWIVRNCKDKNENKGLFLSSVVCGGKQVEKHEVTENNDHRLSAREDKRMQCSIK